MAVKSLDENVWKIWVAVTTCSVAEWSKGLVTLQSSYKWLVIFIHPGQMVLTKSLGTAPLVNWRSLRYCLGNISYDGLCGSHFEIYSGSTEKELPIYPRSVYRTSIRAVRTPACETTFDLGFLQFLTNYPDLFSAQRSVKFCACSEYPCKLDIGPVSRSKMGGILDVFC